MAKCDQWNQLASSVTFGWLLELLNFLPNIEPLPITVGWREVYRGLDDVLDSHCIVVRARQLVWYVIPGMHTVRKQERREFNNAPLLGSRIRVTKSLFVRRCGLRLVRQRFQHVLGMPVGHFQEILQLLHKSRTLRVHVAIAEFRGQVLQPLQGSGHTGLVLRIQWVIWSDRSS